MSELVERKRGREWGRVFKRGSIWWIGFYVNGDEQRESSYSEDESDAWRLLKTRRKEVFADRYVRPEERRRTVDELLDDLVKDLEHRNAKALVQFKSHMKPVRDAFGSKRAVTVTTSDLRDYITTRLTADKAPATINREVGGLRQAYNLAKKEGRLTTIPHFPMMGENNVRRGFFEHAEVLAILEHLPEPISEIVRFAYLSGWRKGEIVALPWSAVDRTARQVRLATSKNGRPRTLPLDGSLWDLIERRWAARKISKADGTTAISEYVFHRTGEPVVDFRKAWSAACAKAGLHGKLFHDLRRTAVRNMVRAGVPQTVAMSISGHQTTAMFNRYDIASDGDKIDALRKTAGHLAAQPEKRQDGAEVHHLEAARTKSGQSDEAVNG